MLYWRRLLTITLKTTLYMVLPMFCGCLETKNQLLPTEFRAISPNESVIYVSESTNRLVSLTPSTSEIAIKSISTNCFISNVVALSSETLIGQSKDAVFLGTTVDQSIHFLRALSLHVPSPRYSGERARVRGDALMIRCRRIVGSRCTPFRSHALHLHCSVGECGSHDS